jgi:cell division protease FtsH
MLLEKEVIFGEDLEQIFGKRPWKKEERIASNAAMKAEAELEKARENESAILPENGETELAEPTTNHAGEKD